MGEIFKNKFKAYFTSFRGYAILTAVLLAAGVSFTVILKNGGHTAQFYTAYMYILLFATPFITMFSFGKRCGYCETDEPDAQSGAFAQAFGSFFASYLFYEVCCLPTVLFQLVTLSHIKADNLLYLSRLIGLLLLGLAFVGFGNFIAYLFKNRAASAFANLAFALSAVVADNLIGSAHAVSVVAAFISPAERYKLFLSGGVDFAVVILCVTVSVLAICATAMIEDVKRTGGGDR